MSLLVELMQIGSDELGEFPSLVLLTIDDHLRRLTNDDDDDKIIERHE